MYKVTNAQTCLWMFITLTLRLFVCYYLANITLEFKGRERCGTSAFLEEVCAVRTYSTLKTHALRKSDLLRAESMDGQVEETALCLFQSDPDLVVLLSNLIYLEVRTYWPWTSSDDVLARSSRS